ncbi:MAG: 16S rRNA (guanine(527)-N(7))-methyltransferase RsmG [Phycisphaerae bacterium]|nr:16S rRNA (guanine(527)-N(7))-methyltransferase RsmG [Phycisphaerae bacterium]
MSPDHSIESPPPAEFHQALEQMHIELEPGELEQHATYLRILAEANQTMNLTRIVQPDQAWMRHVLDGLTLVPLVQAAEAGTLCDIGSGGGVPGLILAISMPRVEVVLLEATGKKAAFLERCAAELGCENVRVVHARAEHVGAPGKELREHFDVVTARAVGRLPMLLELAMPLVRVEGYFIAVKGEQVEQEIREAGNALRTLATEHVELTRTPTGRLALFHKLRATPETYPRQSGEPTRRPL